MSSAKALAGLLPSSNYDNFLTVDQTALDAVPAAVYLCRTDGVITRFNKRAADLWGCTPRAGDTDEQFLGSARISQRSAQSLSQATSLMQEVLRTGVAQRDKEVVFERADGSKIVALVNIEPLTDGAGRIEGAVNCFHDITTRKRAEEDALSSRSDLEDFFENAVAPMHWVAADGRIIRTNQAELDLLGYRRDEYVGRNIADFHADADRIKEIIGCLVQGRTLDKFPARLRAKDGSVKHVLISSRARIRDGRFVNTRCVTFDVTEQQHARTQLEDSEARYRRLFQDAQEEIVRRREAEQSLARRMEEQAALFDFTNELYRCESQADAYECALKAIMRALRCDRASILLFDESKRMKFVASRGLSEEYRRAVEGHSPWSPEDADPQPISVGDIGTADLPDALRAIVRAEGIAALSFVPVMAEDRLAGKFMTYYDAPHHYSAEELDLALSVARQLGFAIERGRAEDARRSAESEREFLVQELSHRVKNTLATVISIQNQSFSRAQSVEEARHSFSARIRALAQTHGRLAEGNWVGVPLDTLLTDEMAPYRREDGANVQLAGSPVKLNAKSALTLGMAMHELATNAAKHGALSQRAGAISITWDADQKQDQLRIRWKERGGPPVVRPKRSGFGRLLLERVLTADLGGKVELDFAPDGLACAIEIPLSDNLAGS